MLNGVSVDYGTMGLLAIVLWLDGWRRLPADALLVARAGSGPWRVRAPWATVGPLALVALWAPLVVPVLLVREGTAAADHCRWMDDFSVSVARARRRYRRMRGILAALRIIGLLLTIWVIVGIPLAAARFGGPGLIYSVLIAFVLALESMFGAAMALRSLGYPVGRSIRTTLQLLSPFSAPRAAEIVTTAAVGPLHTLAPIVALVGEGGFLRWIRPWAYDAVSGREQTGDRAPEMIARLIAGLPASVLERATSPAALDPGGDCARYCPRCTRAYREVVTTCSACDDLPLVAVGR
jgi:hypothetical protein